MTNQEKEIFSKWSKEPGTLVPIKDPNQYREMALLAAQTLPNQSAAELLSSADKIEAWLKQPRIDRLKINNEVAKMAFENSPRHNEIFKLKSPEKINPEASDGVSGD